MKKIIIHALVILCAVFIASQLQANVVRSIDLTGSGLGLEYSYGEENILGANLTYRSGIFNIISLYYGVDIGYRLQDKSINGRAGIGGLLMFIGIETGIRIHTDLANPHYATRPGLYVALAGVLPSRDIGLFLNIGGSFFFKEHSNEFFISCTYIVNFAKQ